MSFSVKIEVQVRGKMNSMKRMSVAQSVWMSEVVLRLRDGEDQGQPEMRQVREKVR